jgi:hypothetical protein
MQHYNRIVLIEFGAAALGAVVLGIAGEAAYIAPWVCFVVGVHFWSLAPVFNDPFLRILSVAFVVIAIAGVIAQGQTTVAGSAVTGAAAGVALLVTGLRDLWMTFASH